MFDSSDHRSHRRQEWLERGLKKIEQLEFLTEGLKSTIGQIAIKFSLSAPMVAAVLPTITNMPQLQEFAAAPDTEDLPPEFLDRITELYDADFNLEPASASADWTGTESYLPPQPPVPNPQPLFTPPPPRE